MVCQFVQDNGRYDFEYLGIQYTIKQSTRGAALGLFANQEIPDAEHLAKEWADHGLAFVINHGSTMDEHKAKIEQILGMH